MTVLQNAMSPDPDGNIMPSWIAILTWLKLIRLHRLVELFTNHMEYNLKVDDGVTCSQHVHVQPQGSHRSEITRGRLFPPVMDWCLLCVFHV
jgi:hypothetical protein